MTCSPLKIMLGTLMMLICFTLGKRLTTLLCPDQSFSFTNSPLLEKKFGFHLHLKHVMKDKKMGFMSLVCVNVNVESCQCHICKLPAADVPFRVQA